MDNCTSICISKTASILEALDVIDKGEVQIALIVDHDNKLLGTLTDGDVRRGILNGHSLGDSVYHVMNTVFKSANHRDNVSYITGLMRESALSQIPILDDEGRVIRLELLKEFLSPKTIDNIVVIMAGGKGTRLRPLTETCPKPMLTIDGKPMLHILFEQLKQAGFRNFYVSVNYLKENIINYFGDGSSFGVSIDYLVEESPLGTAGSLSLLDINPEKPIIVINGDVLSRLDLKSLLKFHNENNSKATIAVRQHTTTIPFGIVRQNGVELVSFQEKPSFTHLVNAGMYVISPQLLPLIPKYRFTDMPDFLLTAKDCGHKVTVCPVHEYWLDVGRPETLVQATREWPSDLSK